MGTAQELHDEMSRLFNKNEFSSFFFRLNLDYDNFEGNLDNKIIGVIRHYERRNCLPQLEQAVAEYKQRAIPKPAQVGWNRLKPHRLEILSYLVVFVLCAVVFSVVASFLDEKSKLFNAEGEFALFQPTATPATVEPTAAPAPTNDCVVVRFSAEPPSPVSHGREVALTAEGSCNGEVRAMRFWISNISKAEAGSNQIAEIWKTGEFNKGEHQVCVQVTGGQNNTSWETAAESCLVYTVE